MKVTAYNTFGTKESRVVASFEVETFDVREALTEANYRACLWNKTEERENMRVNFVGAGAMLRPV
jgi:hypothetical protein